MSQNRLKWRRYRKPYHKKRRPWYAARNMAGYAATAMTALKIAKEVKAMVNVEFKYHDTSITQTPTNAAAGTVNWLTDMAQGDGETERDGNSCKLKSIKINILIKKHATPPETALRLLLIKEIENDGTINYSSGTDSSIMENTTAWSVRDPNGLKRYILLKDWMISLDTYHATRTIKYFRKLNHQAQWDKDTTTAKAGHLYLLSWCDQATNSPNIYINSRVRYIDN